MGLCNLTEFVSGRLFCSKILPKLKSWNPHKHWVSCEGVPSQNQRTESGKRENPSKYALERPPPLSHKIAEPRQYWASGQMKKRPEQRLTMVFWWRKGGSNSQPLDVDGRQADLTLLPDCSLCSRRREDSRTSPHAGTCRWQV